MTRVARSAASNSPSLRTDYFWSMSGVGAYALCQSGAIVLLAKFGAMEIVGRYALTLAITAPVLMLSNLELRRVIATSTTPADRLGDYMRLRVATSILAVTALAVFAMLVDGSEGLRAGIIAMAGAKAIESVSDLLYGYFQKRERIDLVGKSQILRSGLTIAAIAVAFPTGSVFWIACAMAAANAAALCLFDVPWAASLRRASSDGVRERLFGPLDASARLAWIAWPLGISAAVTSLSASVPRCFIEHFLGERALGLFAALAAVLMLGMLASGALVHATLQRFSRCYARRQRKAFLDLLARCLGVCAIVGIAGVVLAASAGPAILEVLYSPEYAAHGELFRWIAVAFAVQYASGFLSGTFSAMRRFKTHLAIAASSVALLIVLSDVLIARHGLLGAAWAVLAVKTFDMLAFGAAIVVLLFRESEPIARDVPGREMAAS